MESGSRHCKPAALRGPDGKLVGVFAAARDVTEQKTLENRLPREAQNYTRGLIDSSVDGLIITDLGGVITDINTRVELLTGLPRSALIGTRFMDYFTEPDRSEAVIQKVLTDSQVSNYELTISTRQGVQTALSYNATTYLDNEGRLKGIIAAARDITEQRRLRGELEQRNRELEARNRVIDEASRMKSRFLANMSHELRVRP